MWRDISSAPRDRTAFRARDATGRIFNCRWWPASEMNEFYADPPGTWQAAFCEYFGPNEPDGDAVEPTYWWDNTES